MSGITPFIKFLRLIVVLSVFVGVSSCTTPAINQCGCGENASLGNIIKCDTITFRNKSKVFRQFNCDSTWLVFENNQHEKRVLNSLSNDLMPLASSLGYHYVIEYSNMILFKNRRKSGNNFPEDYILIKKDNGEVYEELGPLLFYSSDYHNSYVLFRSDNDAIILYFMNTNKKYSIILPEEMTSDSRQPANGIHSDFVVDETVLSDTTITLKYKYLKSEDANNWHRSEVVVDLDDFIR